MSLEEIEMQMESSKPITVSNSREKAEEKKEKKKETLWEKLFNRRKLKKPNIVAVLFLRNNAKAVPMEVESKRGFFSINGETYNEDKECVYRFPDGTPLAVIEEHNLLPKGTDKWLQKEMTTKFFELQDHVLKGIRHAELVRMGQDDNKMKINPKVAIGLLIIGIVAFAILQNYI